MNLKMYSIYDVKAGAYITPFFLPNDQVAIRVFTQNVNDTGTQFGQNPEDYTLHYFATFGIIEGTLALNEKPSMLVSGLEVLKQEKEDKPELKSA